MELASGLAEEAHAATHAAERLAASIRAGEPLPVIGSPVLLSRDEVLHAQIHAIGWRFHAVAVIVEQQRILTTPGGALASGFAAASTAIGNRRARVEAQRLANPQWRPLGEVPILATNQRLLVFHEGAWASVWYSAIRQVVPHLDENRIELIFVDDPPYLLVGEWVPYLAVVITAVLAGHYGADSVRSSMLLSDRHV